MGDEIIPMQPLNSKPNLIKIQEGHPDYLYCGSQASVSGLVLKDFYQLGMNKETVFVGALDQYADQGVKMAGGEASEGVLVPRTHRLYPADVKGLVLMRDKFKQWRGEEWDDYYHFGFAAGFAATEAIRIALSEVGHPITGQDVYNAAMKVKDFHMYDVQPPITWGPNDRQGSSMIFLYEIRNSKFVLKEPKPVDCPHIKRIKAD